MIGATSQIIFVFCALLLFGTIPRVFGNWHGGVHHTFHFIANKTLAGTDIGCKHTTSYVTTSIVSAPMCIGQTDQDLKNGMSIINLIASRGYLPTCRVMHLLLWMASEVSEHRLGKDFFVDVGANIGSCTMHMASLGFPVISVEPVQQHVDTIRGTMSINPSFHIELHHIGMSIENKTIHANFGHGARNWGATEFHEVKGEEKFETELKLRTLEQVLGHRHVSLLKVDCEGCEWAAIKGAGRALRKIPMIKMETVQVSYEAGNETITTKEMLQYLEGFGFKLFYDLWEEQSLYFGRRPNDVLDIDRIFGSKKFNLNSDIDMLNSFARKMLENPIEAISFDRNAFLKRATDIIAIEASLVAKMRSKWL